MGYLNRYNPATLARELCLVILAVIWWIPFYVLLTVMLKPAAQATRSPFSPPTELELSNFSKAWQGSGGIGLGAAALNSAIISAGSVLALIAVARRLLVILNALVRTGSHWQAKLAVGT